jgi:hypothetical protein
MISLVADKERELRATCERFGVRRLELFGSAATGDEFDPEHSDIDFLVEFQPEQNLGPWLQHFFEFRRTLEQLFGHSVDLVMPSAMKNAHFIREVNRTRRPVYAA